MTKKKENKRRNALNSKKQGVASSILAGGFSGALPVLLHFAWNHKRGHDPGDILASQEVAEKYPLLSVDYIDYSSKMDFTDVKQAREAFPKIPFLLIEEPELEKLKLFEPKVMFISTQKHSLEHVCRRLSEEGVPSFSVKIEHKFQELDHPETEEFLNDRLFDEHVIIVKDPALFEILRGKLALMHGKPTATVLHFEDRFEGEFIRKFLAQDLNRRLQEHRAQIRPNLRNR